MDLNVPHEPYDFAGTPGVRIRPQTVEQLAEALAAPTGPVSLHAAEARDLASPLWVDLSAMNRVRAYRREDLMINVETGITLGELNRILAAEGHAFALGYPDDTRLFEVLGEDRAALETGLAGYPRDYVLKSEVVTSDGQITHYGADVVKNVTGYDLNKLYVGSHHALAVLSAVTLKLQGAAQARVAYLLPHASLQAALAQARLLLDTGLPLRQCEVMAAERLPGAKAPWQLWMELAGESQVLESAVAVLREVIGPLPAPVSDARAVQARLHAWPDWVVEVAVPAGSLADFAGQAEGAITQLRPAAGLCYWIPTGAEWQANLPALNRQPEALGGFLRLMRAPLEGRPLVEAYNLPADPIQRDLMRRLKQGYDPAGRLYSRLLPLEGAA